MVGPPNLIPGLGPGPDVPEPSRHHALDVMLLALRIGEVMVANAESVADSESGMRRVLVALGVPTCAVVVEMNSLTLSWIPHAGEPITVAQVVDADDPHLHRLVAVEKLIGRIERGEVGTAGAKAALERAAVLPDPYPAWLVTVARLASVAGWVVFSGGGPQAVAVGVAATALMLPLLALVARSRVPDVFVVLVGAAGVVLVPYGVVWAGLEFAVGPAVIGGLYQFLPGRALVSSVSDGLSGAPVSALARGLQAIVVAVGVAVGVLAALGIVDALDIDLPAIDITPWPAVVTMAAAGVAVGALAIARQVPVVAVAPVVGLGMLLWLVANDLGTSGNWQREAAVGLAALILGFAGQLLARLQRTIPALYTGVAVLVLVPGTILYSAMLQFAVGQNESGAEQTLQAITVAVAIAAGTTLGVAVGRAMPGLSMGSRPSISVRRPPPAR